MNVASAQQLPNVGFELWKDTDAMGKTHYLGLGAGDKPDKPRPANGNVTEPAGWNGSNVEQVGQKGFFVGQEVDETGNVAVQLKNDFVGLGPFGDNARDSSLFATPWVYANFNTDICDGGAFGGVKFTFKPDAIKGKFKKMRKAKRRRFRVSSPTFGTGRSLPRLAAPTIRKENLKTMWIVPLWGFGSGRRVGRWKIGGKVRLRDHFYGR